MFEQELVDIYKIWAPPNSVWSRWAKPVIFMHYPTMGPNTPKAKSGGTGGDYETFDMDAEDSVSFEKCTRPKTWFGEFREDTAVIIDLPGDNSVEEAIDFARIGYRPVPLYNGVDPDCGSPSEVNKTDLARRLFQMSKELTAIRIRDNAPPVFMLDTNRRGIGIVTPGRYDNRWNIFAQDMPSIDFLRDHGISNILLRTTGPHLERDLQHILYRYAEKKIVKFTRYNGTSIEPIHISKPASYKSTFYRLSAILGFKRNAAGGFGALTPEVVDTDSYSGSYRYG